MSCNSLVNTTIYKNHKRILILFLKLLVVHQEFETDVFKSSVIVSNDILLQCVLPSHVSDLLEVSSWADSEGNTFTADNSYGKPREPEMCLCFKKRSWKLSFIFILTLEKLMGILDFLDYNAMNNILMQLNETLNLQFKDMLLFCVGLLSTENMVSHKK